MINVTENAAQKAIALMEKDASLVHKSCGLRIKVVGGGCSGYRYELGFDEKKDLDRTFGGFGLNVFIDSRSLLYLAGSTLDYNDGLMESGFKVENPNANSTCGCGESFSA